MSQSGVEIPLTQNELLALFGTGDTGHEYKKMEINSLHSNLLCGPQAGNSFGRIRPGSGGEVIADLFFPNVGINASLLPDRTPSWAVSDSTLQDLGENFIHIYDPIQQGADLLVSLGEIFMDGLPKNLGKALFAKGIKGRPVVIKRIAEEYLNYIFGIKPLISDIRAILDVADKADKIVSQWIRNNHKQVRRRRQFPERVTAQPYVFQEGNMAVNGSYAFNVFLPRQKTWVNGSWVPTGPVPYWLEAFGVGMTTGSYRYAKWAVLKEKLRFSTAYEYALENLLPGDDAKQLSKLSNKELEDLIKLQYLGLNPADVGLNLIWSLTPWSWMVDWFTNIGQQLDYLRQIQAVGLRVDYAYITSVQEMWTKTESSLYGSAGQVESSLMYRQSTEFKQLYMRRLKASPFGFKVNFGSLTSDQLLTLGALALSRGSL